MNETNKAHEALSELIFRNPQRHDGHAYELELAAWGLGIKPNRPKPESFGQLIADKGLADDFAALMADIYREGKDEKR